MSRLLDQLNAQAAEAAQAMNTSESEHAIAIAYGRMAAENQVIVDEAIGNVTTQNDPAPVLTSGFVAAIAALPAEARLEAMNRLQSTVNGNRKLASRAGWSTLKKRIKEAAQKVDAARAGARNAEGSSNSTVVEPSDYLAMAHAFAARYEELGYCVLRRWKGRWFRWNGAIYEELDDEAVDGMAYQFLATLLAATGNGPQPLQPNKKLVEYLLHAFAPLVQVPDSSPLRWLDADQQQRPAIDRCVFCRNGTLSVDAWLAGTNDAFIAPTPALFILRTLAMPYDPTATATAFQGFIGEIFDGDRDRIIAMQILFGYWLIASTLLQIIVIFSGLPQTGKGSLLTIVQGVLGIMCANPAFEQLGGMFGLEDLVGANLAILSDVHDTGPNAKSAVEKLLKISGEDAVDVPRKHKPALNSVCLPARFILAMNELISLPDASGALSRRLVVIPFRHSFLGKGQAGLAKQIIAAEGPGVLLWAMDGLRLLIHIQRDAEEKGLPTKDTVIAMLRTKEAESDHELLDDLSNPVRVFMREQCCLGMEHIIDLDTMYLSWDQWRESSGHQRRSKSRMVADLLAASKGMIAPGQRTAQDGTRLRILKGITTQQALRQLAIAAAELSLAQATAASKATAMPASLPCLSTSPVKPSRPFDEAIHRGPPEGPPAPAP